MDDKLQNKIYKCCSPFKLKSVSGSTTDTWIASRKIKHICFISAHGKTPKEAVDRLYNKLENLGWV